MPHPMDRRLLKEAADLWREFANEEREFYAKRSIHRRRTSESDARDQAARIDDARKQGEPMGPLDPLYVELTRRSS